MSFVLLYIPLLMTHSGIECCKSDIHISGFNLLLLPPVPSSQSLPWQLPHKLAGKEIPWKKKNMFSQETKTYCNARSGSEKETQYPPIRVAPFQFVCIVSDNLSRMDNIFLNTLNDFTLWTRIRVTCCINHLDIITLEVCNILMRVIS